LPGFARSVFPQGTPGKTGVRGDVFATDLPKSKANWRFTNEDGQKPSSRLGGRSRCRGWGTGGRSSRKGQAGRIREGLQPVRCRLLVRSGDGHVPKDRLLRACGRGVESER